MPALNGRALKVQAPTFVGDQLRWICMPAKAGICFTEARGFSPVKTSSLSGDNHD